MPTVSEPQQPPPKFVLQSPAAAYRADAAGRDQPFGPHDDAWIAIATLLEHAALLPEGQRDEHLREATAIARELLGDDEIQRKADWEWENRDRSPIDAILLVADEAHATGALNLASVMLDALAAADVSLGPMQLGRISYVRANVAWKLGDTEEAENRCRVIEEVGHRENNAELKVRAWVGLAGMAQLRGNYPEMGRYSRQAAELADHDGLRKLGRYAHSGLMVVAGAAHRFDEALFHGWAVYQASAGHPIEEADVLGNLGQLLFEAGCFAEARAAFAAVVSREMPARIILAALGGLAMSSAALGDEVSVGWAVRQVEHMEALTVPRYAFAVATIECATALTMVGQFRDAERSRARAKTIAERHGFHEVAYRADSLDTSRRPLVAAAVHVLDQTSATIAREVAWLEPKRLPEQVALAIASSFE